MFVKVNGEKMEIAEETTLEVFLAENNINPRKVIIELNRGIIAANSRDKIVIKENDIIEILSFVGGG